MFYGEVLNNLIWIVVPVNFEELLLAIAIIELKFKDANWLFISACIWIAGSLPDSLTSMVSTVGCSR